MVPAHFDFTDGARLLGYFFFAWMDVRDDMSDYCFLFACGRAARFAFVCLQNSSHMGILVERTKQPRLGGSEFGSCKNSLVLSSAAG